MRNQNLVTHTITDGLGRVIQTHTQTEACTDTGTGTRAGSRCPGPPSTTRWAAPVREWQPTFLDGRTAGPSTRRCSPPRAPRPTRPPPATTPWTNPSSTTDHDGAVTRWSRATGDRPPTSRPAPTDQQPGRDCRCCATVVTDTEGRGSATATDPRGQMRINTDLPGGGPAVVTRYDLDALGQLRRVSQGGRPGRSRPADQHLRPRRAARIATTSPDGGRIDFGYDTFGNLTSRQTPNQRADRCGDRLATTYTYAFGGQLRSIDHPDSHPRRPLRYDGYGGAPAAREAPRAGSAAVIDGAKDQRLELRPLRPGRSPRPPPCGTPSGATAR